MHIGLLTFHASHNYGSVLQAFALSTVLSQLGHIVHIINLRTQAQRHAYRSFHVKGCGWKRILHFLYALYVHPVRKRRFKKFEYFINQVLPITSEFFSMGKVLPGNSQFDAYITGSDQVWNPVCQDFDTAYYLDFVQGNARKIAYAPSLGRTEFSSEQLSLIQQLLKNMDCISCREESGAQILRKLTDKTVRVVCDPVVLLERKAWEDFAVQPRWREPYILTYFLENNNGDKRHLKELQNATGYKVVSLNEDIRDIGKGYHNAFDASPQEFVGLIQNAAFVLTNSFHATAFSTIFRKPFYTVCGEPGSEANPNDSRKIDYLQRLGLENRVLRISQSLPKREFWDTIDYDMPVKAMEAFRTESRQYLLDALAK